MALFALMTLSILRRSNKCRIPLFCNTFAYVGYWFSLHSWFTSFYVFLFNFLQPCNMLSLSEISSESTLTFPVGVTKLECCMYIMLVRCEVPAPVKVSLRKLSMPAIWIPGLPIPSTVGQIDAFSRSQRAE